MRSRSRVVALACLIVAGCAARPAAVPSAKGAKGAEAQAGGQEATFGLPAVVPKLRFMPDVDGTKGVVVRSEEGDLALIGRMRVRTTPRGVIERADQLLPVGRVVAQRAPSRLGGGFVFLVVASSRTTELWRSKSWLAPLEPLASFGSGAHPDRPLTMGFDRFYVRLQSSNELVALDPKNGAILGYGPLPPAPAFGDMTFLDGWRAVVDTDVQGTMATFDAGATWRRLPVVSRVRSITPSSADPEDGHEAVVQVDAGVYRVSPQGHLTFTAAVAPQAGFAPPPEPRPASPSPLPSQSTRSTLPLGKKPLRTTIERGYPDSGTTAVVAFEGALARVSLESGAILDVAEHALPDAHTECSGIALGDKGTKPSDAIGFVCGSVGGPTVIYKLERPLKVREVMRFSKPRVVTESGQGAIVVRGPCSDEEASGGRPFCVRFADGSTREVRIRGDVGAERVVALQDKRVAILVPPRAGTQGQITILEGKASKSVVLKMPDAGGPRELETGMWLDGFQQTSADEISGWVEAGGPTFGVKIKLDGSVTIGETLDEPGGLLVGGRFGLAIGERGHVLETMDAGMTWREIQLPTTDGASDQLRTRRCSAVGCVFPGWIKVGWGETAHENDLEDATSPPSTKSTNAKLQGGPLSLRCRIGRSEPKRKGGGKKNEGSAVSGWLPLRDVDPPALAAGEAGVDNGNPYDSVPMRAYAWGKKDSDWSRTGRFVVRWQDRFALEDVRSTAATTSPWASEALASETFGVGTYSSMGVQWSAQRDHGAALVSACRDRGGRACALFAVEPDQPVLSLRPAESGGLPKPFANSAVKLGQVWFFLADSGVQEHVGLYRADLGHVRQVTAFRRLTPQKFAAAPLARLVRRSKSEQLGLMFSMREGPLDKRGMRYVLPVNPDTGEIGEPIRIGRPDFVDMAVSSACSEQDGWVADLALDPSPNVSIGSYDPNLEAVELRMRLNPGAACIEAGVGTIAGVSSDDKKAAKPPKTEAASSAGFTLVATDRTTSVRRELLCDMGEHAGPVVTPF